MNNQSLVAIANVIDDGNCNVTPRVKQNSEQRETENTISRKSPSGNVNKWYENALYENIETKFPKQIADGS